MIKKVTESVTSVQSCNPIIYGVFKEEDGKVLGLEERRGYGEDRDDRTSTDGEKSSVSVSV